MSVGRTRLWRYTLACDTEGCGRGKTFTTGGSPMDAEFLRYTMQSGQEGWTTDGTTDRCPICNGVEVEVP